MSSPAPRSAILPPPRRSSSGWGVGRKHNRSTSPHAPMTFDQAAISAILVCTLVLFVWGRWRYDVVAMLSLMTAVVFVVVDPDRSEEHTSELQSLMRISYAVFCLNKKCLAASLHIQDHRLQ